LTLFTLNIPRAGPQLSQRRRDTLEKAKDELRRDFGKEPKKGK
jgi:hypothetical protein